MEQPGILYAEGLLKGTISGERLLFVPAKFLLDVEVFLEKAYGQSVGQVFLKSAEEFGTRYVKQLGSENMTPAQALAMMEKAASIAGWGNFKFSGDLGSGRSIKVENDDCPFCPSVRENLETRCDFASGLSAGIAKAVYQKNYAIDHVDVRGENGTKCVITLTERPGNRREDWKTTVYFPWMLETQ